MNTTESVLRKFNSLKTLPHVAIRLTQLISNENTPINEFEKVIRMDPTLVIRVLRMVNSPYCGLMQKVESISRAVVFIGMRNLRNMIVTEALKDIFRGGAEKGAFSRRKLWLHCVAASICGQMIAERIFGINGEDAFLAGILHDIGLIVEDQVESELFQQACLAYDPDEKGLTEYEQSIIGTHHCTLGYRLAKEWRLSVEVQQGIKHHHDDLKKVDPGSITGILQIAEYIVTQAEFYAVLGNMRARLSSPLTEHIKSNLGEYNVLAKDLPDEMVKAKELYELDEDDI